VNDTASVDSGSGIRECWRNPDFMFFNPFSLFEWLCYFTIFAAQV